ncbi:LOW QUALITY PROTEIN: selenocysteine insertion sequence-binding protein 2 [Lutra lutra]|uniref:LOW QUALITY PROTEIN: selenocysteine insertion sequence-binding protein 2 n=1 Tax=Lutra lutra TaxID=9657 RepID=UPI001FD040E0|nr:LOW QUALITY PROTEIN: selenocysteine insertion sequence-binding protein 2 [Lutra lutra]
MASEGASEPVGEGIKLSADVKPFVPKFAGLRVAWSESSEARVFPGCAAAYYPCVQELPVPEQKLYPEDVAFGSPLFPPQYLSSELALHPGSYSPYPTECYRASARCPACPMLTATLAAYRAFQTDEAASRAECALLPTRPGEPRSRKKRMTSKSLTARRRTALCHLIQNQLEVHILCPFTRPETRQLPETNRQESRIVEKSVSASKPGFEFTRLDFPELQGAETSESQRTQKQPKWGPLRPASADLSLLREVVRPAEGEGAVRSTGAAESVTSRAVAGPSSCTRELSWTPMGYVVRQTLSTERSAAPKNVTSMINLETVASSADPQSVSLSRPEVLSSDPSCREKHVHSAKKSRASHGGDPDQNEASRKHKKKKEKSKSEYEVLTTVQEPPKIEDAEEFPNLAVACERRERGASPRRQAGQRAQGGCKGRGKKSRLPVRLDLGGALAALEQQHSQSTKPSPRPVVFSVGAVPILSRDTASGKKGRLSQVKTPHNPLDSSGPLMKKGKRREGPKAKKPTSLKKIILKERQERKQQRLRENTGSPAPADDAALDGESGGDDGAAEQAVPSEGSDVSLSSAPALEGASEGLPRAELQKEVGGCHPVPSGTGGPKIHSRRFRDYCSQMLSKEVDACVSELLKELVRFQDRTYQRDPVKAKTKRRLVLGLREVLKHLRLRKLKCVIISPNCEKTQSKGGLDDTLHTIIDHACEQSVPFVFALNRKALGRSLNKAVPVSAVGIFSYDGAQDQFHRMVELTTAARQAYKTMLESARHELAGEPGPPVPGGSAQDSPAAPVAGREEPHYMEIWRRHLEAYSRCALELEASTSQMLNLSL